MKAGAEHVLARTHTLTRNVIILITLPFTFLIVEMPKQSHVGTDVFSFYLYS